MADSTGYLENMKHLLLVRFFEKTSETKIDGDLDIHLKLNLEGHSRVKQIFFYDNTVENTYF